MPIWHQGDMWIGKKGFIFLFPHYLSRYLHYDDIIIDHCLSIIIQDTTVT